LPGRGNDQNPCAPLEPENEFIQLPVKQFIGITINTAAMAFDFKHTVYEPNY
jgi:hypothetical protein